MISFIVIGRNEGWKLNKCLVSIFKTTETNKLAKFEVIYVDSKSTDNSIANVTKFPNTRVIQLTGDCNAAIARNVGAKAANGDVLFFIDGDMEIEEESLMEFFDSEMNLKYDFCSGDFQNVYYHDNQSKEALSKEMYHKNLSLRKEFTSGGLFLIKKSVWESVGGMRQIFKRSQDMDLGLRLAKKGVLMHRLPVRLADHHTVSYSSKRLWHQLFDGTHLYGRSLLYRKNILNRYAIQLFIKQDFSLIILLFSSLLSFIFWMPYFYVIYILILALRSYKKKHIKYIGYFTIRDIMVFFGFLFFFPKNRMNVEYKID